MAKQQAKNVANNQSQQQGGNQPAAPQYNPQTPSDPALQATLRNIANLRADLDNLDSNPTNTVPLRKDLVIAAQGTKPSPASVEKLSQTLAAAVAGNTKLRTQHQKLAQYAHALSNGAHLTATQQQTILDNVRKILQDGGVPAENVTAVISDLKTIATETK